MLLNATISWYLKHRIRRIDFFKTNGVEVQKNLLHQLIQSAKGTEWGKLYDYQSIYSQKTFADRIPVQAYDDFKPYIHRMMCGERDILWKGRVKWFSKSSGTTSDKSKFIPVSLHNLKGCHIRGVWDTLTTYHVNHPNAKIFSGKGLVMGGAYEPFAANMKTKRGDVSALMIQNMPTVGKYFYTPDFETALMSEWEEKIKRMAKICSQENVTNIGGVPTWTIVLFREMLKLTGKNDITEIWPNLELYVHGGVSFKPYRSQFQSYIPSDKMNYVETYNASEGYFGVQDEMDKDDMLLLLDNGVYYEFLPMEEWDKEFPKTVLLEDVEVGKVYAMVISTNAGLWRYLLGDTIKFTSKNPFKIAIVGRTKHYINAFGEEVMIENTDKALEMTCSTLGAAVKEYTVAPIFIEGQNKGGHEWLIEFEKYPDSLIKFNDLLDINLQKVNSDYEAKRYKNMALQKLSIRTMPTGSFHNWLKSKGKYGGQSKVPRLANHREYIEEILSFIDG